MFTRVWNDYWRSLNPARVKRALGNRNIVVGISYFVVYTGFLGEEVLGMNKMTWIIWIFHILSVGWGIFLANLFPNSLPEIMFLLPMESRERAQYVRTAYRLRIVCGMVPLVVGDSVLFAIGELHVARLLGFWCGMFLNLLVYNLGLEGCDKDQWYPARKKKLGGYGIWNAMTEAVGLMLLIIQCINVEDTGYGTPPDAAALLVLLLIQGIFCLGVFRYYRPVMEVALEFEETEAVKAGEKQ